MIVFGYVPYAVVLTFIAGIIFRLVRWLMPRQLTGLYNVNATVNDYSYPRITVEILKRIFLFYTLPGTDNTLFVGSLLFHWGIWIALVGHLGVVLPPQVLESMGVTPSLHVLLAMVVGGLGGTMALVGMLILLARRLSTRTIKVGSFTVKLPIRSYSFLDDYFADVVLLLIIIFGLIQTLYLEFTTPGFFENTVAPWIGYLVSFNITRAVTYLLNAPSITLIHIILAMVFIAYFPWSKMMHLFSFIYISPTIARPSIRIRVPG